MKKVVIALILLTFSSPVFPIEKTWYVYKAEYKRKMNGQIRWCYCYSVASDQLTSSNQYLMDQGSYDYAVMKRDRLAARDPETCPGSRCSGGDPDEDDRKGGKWNISDFGSVSIDGETGSYTASGGGKLYGHWYGKIFNAIWVENSSNQKCNVKKYGSYYWGNVKFKFFNKISGYWDYCGKGMQHAISGS